MLCASESFQESAGAMQPFLLSFKLQVALSDLQVRMVWPA